MNDPRAAHPRQPGDGSRAWRLLGLAAVAVGVLVLAAAAFALSYAGIHAVALSAGVSPRLARLYPVIFDATLVVAFAAVLSLRGAGLPSRCYAWLTMLVLLAAAAGADTLHATGARLPHKPAAVAAAIIPWALVLAGFGLLLSMLRQARLRLAAGQDEEGLLEPSGLAEVAGGIDALLGPRLSPGPDGLPAGNGFPVPAGLLVSSEPPAPNGSLAPAQSPALAESPAPNGSPGPETSPALAAGAAAAPGPAGPDTEPKTEPEARAEPKPEARTEPEPEPEPEPETPGPGPEAEPEPEATPEPSPAPALAAARFDRPRSSPTPPEA